VGNIYDEGSGKNSKCLSTCVSETKPNPHFVRYSQKKREKGLSKYVLGKPNPMCVFQKKKKSLWGGKKQQTGFN
jgi:hypothetical protein